MSATVYLNGELVPRERAMVPVDDRGFLFGDGVYEVFRVTGGRLFEPERHRQRLAASLAAIRIEHERADATRLVGVARELLERNGLASADALVYVQVTRGAAVRRHAFPPPGTAPTVFASATAFAPRVAECTEGVAAITHPDVRWGRCDIKSVNLLANVLANQAAHERGAFEAIFVEASGIVTEATHSSVFAVVRGELRTHPLSTRLLPGVTRQAVLELAGALGIPVREEAVTIDELRAAEELFVTGTSTDVMPVVALDAARVADGRPGRVTRRLYEALMERRRSG